MPQQEKSLNLISNQRNLSSNIMVPHRLRVVSVDSVGTVDASEATVHKGHIAQIHNIHDLAARKLHVEAGRPLEVFTGSSPVDITKYRDQRMAGVYDRTRRDTFIYTEVDLGEAGKERLDSVVFTTRSPEDVRRAIQMIAHQATGQREDDSSDKSELEKLSTAA